jgi:hypothetical protein
VQVASTGPKSGVEWGVWNGTLRVVMRVPALGVRPSTLMRRAEDAAGMKG